MQIASMVTHTKITSVACGWTFAALGQRAGHPSLRPPTCGPVEPQVPPRSPGSRA